MQSRTVTLYPGDILQIRYQETQRTPLGESVVESTFEYPYGAVVKAFSTPRYTKRATGRLGRIIFMVDRALRSGIMVTGAPANLRKLLKTLIDALVSLHPDEYPMLKKRNVDLLKVMARHKEVLPAEREQLLQMYSIISKAREAAA